MRGVNTTIVVRQPHDPTLDYHEWITFDESEWTLRRYGSMRVKVDAAGRLNPSMMSPSAQRWICNHPDCHATAFVPDDFIRTSIEAVE